MGEQLGRLIPGGGPGDGVGTHALLGGDWVVEGVESLEEVAPTDVGVIVEERCYVFG